MTFDEFFKKKRIDLTMLEKADRQLFSEFKTHFEQMGEKSFDHTKKFWFNKLRHEFPLAPEVKTEKVEIDNPLAQQTVTEMLGEAVEAPTPKLGFTPKFKVPPSVQAPANDVQPEVAAPKPAFTPRFKPGVTKPPGDGDVPGETKPATGEKPEPVPTVAAEQTVPGGNVPKLGFKPKFKAGVTKPATEEQNEQPAAEDKAAETNSTGEAPAAAATPKLGFKPKFKAAEIPKPAAGEKAAPAEPEKQPDEASNTDEPVQGAKAAQPYKPRFNMKNMPPKGA